MAVIVILKEEFQMQYNRTPEKVQVNLSVKLITYADRPNCSQVDKTMH